MENISYMIEKTGEFDSMEDFETDLVISSNNELTLSTNSKLYETNIKNNDSFDQNMILEDICSRCIPYSRENKTSNVIVEPPEKYMLYGITDFLFPYICHLDDCEYSAIEVHDLMLHFLVHHSPIKSEIQCTICCGQFNFKTYHDLLNHICTNHFCKERQMFSCGVSKCGRAFNRIHELYDHLTYFHTDLDTKLPCSFCFIELVDSTSLESHLRTHLKNTLICSYCSMSFDERDSLLTHISTVHPGLAKKISTFVSITNHERLIQYKQTSKIILNKNIDIDAKEKKSCEDSILKSELKRDKDSKKSHLKEAELHNDKSYSKPELSNCNKTTKTDYKIGEVFQEKNILNELNGINIASRGNTLNYTSKNPSPLKNIEKNTSYLEKPLYRPIDTFSEYIEVPNLDRPDIQIFKADKGMREKCSICSYSCNNSIEMHDHHLQCHMNGYNIMIDIQALFSCRLCRTQFQTVDQLLDHLSHHWGKHVLRYFSCPYCSEQSDRMQVIEDHLGLCHADKRFKFEVFQDTISYLQGMLKCPKCEAMLKWKNEFLNHIDKDHGLKKCVEYLDNEYCLSSKLDNIFVPAHIIEINDTSCYSSLPLISHVKTMSTNLINEPPFDLQTEYSSKYSAITEDQASVYIDPYYSKQAPLPIENYQPNKILNTQMNCHLCPFTCSKLLNFQKHMMIHERASHLLDGFKCCYCEFAHDRLNCIKFHLSKYHADKPIQFKRITNGKEVDVLPNDDILRPSYRFGSNRNAHLESIPKQRNISSVSRNISTLKNNIIQPYHDTTYQFHPANQSKYDNSILGQTVTNEPFKSTRIKPEPHFDDNYNQSSIIRTMNTIDNSNEFNSNVNSNNFYPQKNRNYIPENIDTGANRNRTSRKKHKWSACWEYSFASGFKPYVNNYYYKLPKKRKWLKTRGPSYLSGIGKDYLQSNLPPGMIYANPVKCPECEFRNRVRVNLVRHIKAMHSTDLLQVKNENSSTSNQVGSYKNTKIKQENFDALDNVSVNTDNIDLQNDDMEESNNSFGSEQTENLTSSLRKVFECAYCGLTSKWNRRDISLHILHTHMRKRVYSCNYCEFGSSKSAEIVLLHGKKHHPDLDILVKDDLALFNAIGVVKESPGSTQLLYIKPDGEPIWTLEQLDAEFGYNASSRPLSADSRSRSVESVPPRKKIKLEHPDEEKNVVPRKRAGSTKKIYYEWQCSLCGLTSVKSTRIKHHLIFHHLKLKPFSCPICRIYRWRKEQIEDHMSLEHSDETPMAISTIEDKAGYISRYLKKIRVKIDESFGCTKLMKKRSEDYYTNATSVKKPFPTFYRCLLCDYEEQRHDKTKYHVIKHHLKIGLFSCPFCKLYQWSRPAIERHIVEQHPGKPSVARRTFDEYADYFTTNIQKISSKHQFNLSLPVAAEPVKEVVPRRRVSNQQNRHRSPPGRHTCRRCGYIAETETALVSHVRVHRVYACAYCDFTSNLVAKIQAHCIAMHANLPARHIQLESNDLLAKEARHYDVAANGTNDAGVNAEKMKLDMKMLVCRLCSFIAWDDENATSHALEMHDGQSPDFEMIEQSQTDLEPNQLQLHDVLNESDLELSLHIDESAQNAADTDKEEEAEGVGKPGIDFLYHCCICNIYQSNKVTVMRHHVMSHLHYQPYRCPYCPSAWSVKSSPITKHVKTKHPEKDAVFDCVRDEVLESKVRTGFKRVPVDNDLIPETNKKICGLPKKESKMSGTKRRINGSASNASFLLQHPGKKLHQHRKTFYRCSICGLGTRIKTDMRHHLMREVQYKPYCCLYCGYTEPSRSSMGKHFRVKHQGQEASISEQRDAERDAEVEKMLDNCQVGFNAADKKKRWPGKSLRSRRYNKEQKGLAAAVIMAAAKNSDLDQQLEDKEETDQTIPFEEEKDASQLKHRMSSADFLASLEGPPYECPHCTYSSLTIKPLQAHLVHHTPHRYKCGYCNTRCHYPSWMMKHMKKKHSGKPTKIICVRLDANAPIQKVLRRHHAKRAKKLTMNLRNCNSTGRLFKSRSNPSKRDFVSEDETIPDSDTEYSQDIDSKFNHENNFGLREVTVLVKPLKYPKIEVLPVPCEGELTLQRCGFCPFESFSTEHFREHVRRHTEKEPVSCVRCSFACFEDADIERHWKDVHYSEADSPPSKFIPLTEPYTMQELNCS